MSVKICQSCRGKKKIMGLGMIEKNCEVCNGIGFISAEVKTESKAEVTLSINHLPNADAEPSAVQEKRRGRPPKSV